MHKNILIKSLTVKLVLLLNVYTLCVQITRTTDPTETCTKHRQQICKYGLLTLCHHLQLAQSIFKHLKLCRPYTMVASIAIIVNGCISPP